MELKPGTLLERGKYRIIRALGRGGFGVTYLAEQRLAGRNVCIKEFFPKNYYTRNEDTTELTLSSDGFGELMDRYKIKFYKEAQTIAKLDHPNIVHIHDVFEENNTVYYAMDYVEGGTLSDLVKRGGALNEELATKYISQIAAALEYIHERKIMHLDVKPANVIVSNDGSRVVLIDFGLAKHYNEHSGEATSTTPVGVSHGYAPLEQYLTGGVKRFAPETDIYSLGATMYYLVTSTTPPEAAIIANEGLPTMPHHLSAGFRNCITRSMADKLRLRPHSIAEFMALLSGVTYSNETDKTEVFTLNTTNDTPKAGSRSKSKRSWLWILLIITLIPIALWVIGFITDNDKSENRDYNRSVAEQEVTTTTGTTDTPQSETKQPKSEYKNESETSKTLQQKRYNIGDYYDVDEKVGIVFDVWDGGLHGKIVSMNETKIRWCIEQIYREDTCIGAVSHEDGRRNTNIVKQKRDINNYPALKWCIDKGDGWYLPAINELEAIYNNIYVINEGLSYNHGVQLHDAWYRSSTEYDGPEKLDYLTPDMSIWCLNPFDDEVILGGSKKDENYIRAVNTF